MTDLIKDGFKATTRDFYTEFAMRKMDQNSDMIINSTTSDKQIYGKVVSASSTAIVLQTKEGKQTIDLEDILDAN